MNPLFTPGRLRSVGGNQISSLLVPDENPEALVGAVKIARQKSYGNMQDAIQSGASSQPEAIRVIGQFRSKIGGDPLIQHLKTPPLGSFHFEKSLVDALNELKEKLAG